VGTVKCDPRYLGGRAVESLARYKAAGLVMPGDKMHAALVASAVRRYVQEQIRDRRAITL
jgi:hypothetical protein